MEHKSARDLNEHSTISCFDGHGRVVCKAHVTKDPKKQQVIYPLLPQTHARPIRFNGTI